MNKNKAKCDILKKIRKNIADKLSIELHQKECTFEGTCTGTCPKCKQEEDILNREISKRMGALTIGAVMGLSMAGCTLPNKYPDNISGLMELPYVEPSENENPSETSSNPNFIPLPSNLDDVDWQGGITYNPNECIEEFEPLAGDVVYIEDNEEDKSFDEKEENSNEEEKEEDIFMIPTAGVLPYDGE